MKCWLICLTAAAAVAGAMVQVCPLNGQEKAAEPEKTNIWMAKKLEYTQNILAGLTQSDFDKVSRNAKNMNFVGHLEKWAMADKPDYKRQVSYFDFANAELIRQANDKNLDGATLAYNQLVTSCVQCHKVVRTAKK